MIVRSSKDRVVNELIQKSYLNKCRLLLALFEDYNFKQGQRIHKMFDQCYDTLESLFD